MDKTISLAILAGGIVLLIFGVIAANSVSSDFSRFFTDAPTDKAIWLLVGGAVATMFGLVGFMRSS